MRKRHRIGILGGTFNPPHLGHLVLAREVLNKLKLDKVLFIPAYIPPHKKIKDNNAYLRYRMVLLACKGNSKFEVSKIELERKTISYSVDTLQKLWNRYGKDIELFFIIGSDSLDELENWKDIDKILRLAKLIVVNRPGFPVKRVSSKIKQIKIPALDISSSMIRDRMRNSKSIRYLVPELVRKFIIKNKLYK